MKRHSFNFVKDTGSILSLRLKLIFKDITTLAALLSAAVIFTLVIHILSASAEEQSAIPVGFVDNDASEESKALVERISGVPALRVISKDEKELDKLLKDEMVNAVFVITKGYSEKLKKGSLKGLISMYYVENNKSATVISDIVAGEMIYPVSLYKSMDYYRKLPFAGKRLTDAEYEDYVKKLLAGSTDFDFAFNMIYENPVRAGQSVKPVTNSLLYNQLIFGILGILISFIAMFIISGTVKDKETGANLRLKISKFSQLKQDAAGICSVIIVEGVIGAAFSFLIYRQLKLEDLSLLPSSFLLILMYAVTMGGVFILVSKLVKSIITYQMVCTVLILLAGGLGFYHLLSGFYQFISCNILKIIPNSWFIGGFTDIIVYGGESGSLTDGHGMLLLLAAVLIVLIIMADLISDRTGIRRRTAALHH